MNRKSIKIGGLEDMILPTMNKKEILKEVRPVFSRQDEATKKLPDRVRSLARISYRRKHVPVYVGARKLTYQGTDYYAVIHLNYPFGTNAKAPAISLTQTFALTRSIKGKPLLLYINPAGEEDRSYFEESNVITYSHHFLSRFFERTKGYEPPSSYDFEKLMDYFFKEAGLNRAIQKIEDIGYKDFPPPLCIARTDLGLELGSFNTEKEIFYMNTFIPENMFHSKQIEDYGEDSVVFQQLLQRNEEVLGTENLFNDFNSKLY